MLRVFRVLRILRVVPPHCLWKREVTFFALYRSCPQKPKVKMPNKDPRRPLKAPQRVWRSRQGAMVVRQVSRCALWCHCRLRVMPAWFCCASGICLGLCRAFCASYASYSS